MTLDILTWMWPLITETWLNNSAEDQAWLKASALPKNGWCCSHSNRESLARGRG